MHNLLSFLGLFKRNPRLWAFVGVALSILGAALLISWRHQIEQEKIALRGVEELKAAVDRKSAPEKREPAAEADISPRAAPSPSTSSDVGYSKRVAIVIDDFGWNDDLFNLFAQAEDSITIAVLPFLPYSRSVAVEAHMRNMEVILHLPMEPMDYPQENPGKGALLTSMSDEEIRRTLLGCMEEVPFISGINNHMGSKATGDRRLMGILFGEMKSRGLYFLDSLTEPDSVALPLSKEMRVKLARRDVFLDNDEDEEKTFRQFMQLLGVAQRRGWAIGIGHPHLTTLQALRRALPVFRESGVEVVPVSLLLR